MSDSKDSMVTYTAVSSPFGGLSDIGSLLVDGPPLCLRIYAYVVAAFRPAFLIPCRVLCTTFTDFVQMAYQSYAPEDGVSPAESKPHILSDDAEDDVVDIDGDEVEEEKSAPLYNLLLYQLLIRTDLMWMTERLRTSSLRPHSHHPVLRLLTRISIRDEPLHILVDMEEMTDPMLPYWPRIVMYALSEIMWEIMLDLERDVSYGITNTWDEMLVDMPGAPTTDDKAVALLVIDIGYRVSVGCLKRLGTVMDASNVVGCRWLCITVLSVVQKHIQCVCRKDVRIPGEHDYSNVHGAECTRNRGSLTNYLVQQNKEYLLKKVDFIIAIDQPGDATVDGHLSSLALPENEELSGLSPASSTERKDIRNGGKKSIHKGYNFRDVIDSSRHHSVDPPNQNHKGLGILRPTTFAILRSLLDQSYGGEASVSMNQNTVMSDSEDSTVTYTAVSSPFGGLSDIESLGDSYCSHPRWPWDPYA
ncbi:hypothetical protein Tco_0795914 [Tanacetum coccineum]